MKRIPGLSGRNALLNSVVFLGLDKGTKNVFIIMIAIGCVAQMLAMTVINPRVNLAQALHSITKYVQRFNKLPVFKRVSQKNLIRLRVLSMTFVS